MVTVKLGVLEYLVFEAGEDADGNVVYSIKVNYGWKTPYLKSGSQRFNAVMKAYRSQTIAD